jgi:hypothetical protein
MLRIASLVLAVSLFGGCGGGTTSDTDAGSSIDAAAANDAPPASDDAPATAEDAPATADAPMSADAPSGADARGSGMNGDICTTDGDCMGGLSCCYPCGIPDCDYRCEPTCTPGTPGCFDGCLLRP